MAGNIVHMLICKSALLKFAGEDSKHHAFITELFGENLTNKQRFVWANFGSLAPDLFYYDNPAKALWLFYAGKYLGAERLEPWSYHMHSIRPNELPLKLLEITFRDAIFNNDRFALEDVDYKKLAFIAGYLTHMATDQVIHISANRLSGPYYRNGRNIEIGKSN